VWEKKNLKERMYDEVTYLAPGKDGHARLVNVITKLRILQEA